MGGNTGKIKLDLYLCVCLYVGFSAVTLTQLMLVSWLITVGIGMKSSRPSLWWAKWYAGGGRVRKQLASKTLWSQPPGGSSTETSFTFFSGDFKSFTDAPKGRNSWNRRQIRFLLFYKLLFELGHPQRLIQSLWRQVVHISFSENPNLMHRQLVPIRTGWFRSQVSSVRLLGVLCCRQSNWHGFWRRTQAPDYNSHE